MASTFSSKIRLEKQGQGENNNSWGTLLNTLIDLVDVAIAGMVSIATTGGTTTLTTANGTTDEARYAILKITGVLVSNSTIVVPSSSKLYTVWNATSGAYTVTVKTSGGSGIAVTQGLVTGLFCDGTDVKSAQTEVSDAELSAIAGLTSAADRLPYFTGSGTAALATFTSAARSLLDDATVAAMVTTLGAASLSVAQTFTAANRGAVTALTSTAASIAVDLGLTNNFSHTLTENTTLAAPTNAVAGQSGVIAFTQHASSPKTLAYNAFWKFAGGTIPTLTATNGATDVFTYYVNSASFATCQLIKGVA